MCSKVLNYEEIKNLVGKKVYVYYVDKHWGLRREDLESNYHTVVEDYPGVYDLADSHYSNIGSVEHCININKILVFDTKPLLSELLEVCKERGI